MLPHDLPPWTAIFQQAQRWFKAGCFEAMAHDLREIIRLAQGRAAAPTAAVMDSRTIQSTPEGGARSGYAGYKRKKGSKIHISVDTLGHLSALHVSPANEQVAIRSKTRSGHPRGNRRKCSVGLGRSGLYR